MGVTWKGPMGEETTPLRSAIRSKFGGVCVAARIQLTLAVTDRPVILLRLFVGLCVRCVSVSVCVSLFVRTGAQIWVWGRSAERRRRSRSLAGTSLVRRTCHRPVVSLHPSAGLCWLFTQIAPTSFLFLFAANQQKRPLHFRWVAHFKIFYLNWSRR